MIGAQRPEANGIAGRDMTFYSQWLRVGLFEHFHEAKGAKSFPGAEDAIDRPGRDSGDIVGELGRVADQLAVRDKESFRAGVAEALRQLDINDVKECEIAFLVTRLGARLRVARVLDVLTDKAYRIRADGPAPRRLFERAFDTMLDLARAGGRDAMPCLHQVLPLVAHDRRRRVDVVLRAMCEADPDRLDKHYLFLAGDLEAELGWKEDEGAEWKLRGRRERLILALDRRVKRKELLWFPVEAGRDEEFRNWWLNTLENPNLATVWEQAKAAWDEMATEQRPIVPVSESSGAAAFLPLMPANTVAASEQDQVPTSEDLENERCLYHDKLHGASPVEHDEERVAA